MIVNLYGFDKKKNSTKRPSGIGTVLTNVQLKDDTSLMAPVLVINQDTGGLPIPFDPSFYTYVYIPKFSRYYFVTDVRWITGLWEFYLNVDVLASFKPSIGNLSCYVARAAAAYNGDIVDMLYPAKTDAVITSAAVATPWYSVAPSGGCYILGVINCQAANHIGAVSYYALSTVELNLLMSWLFSNNIYNASTITEIGEDLYKSLFNPFQYVVSCIWIPEKANNVANAFENIKVGYWNTGISAYATRALTIQGWVTGTIPDHPQISRGAYLNYSPYTRITLFCPPFGEIPIDPTYLRSGKYLYGKYMLDPITGQATLRIAFAASQSGGYSSKPCIEKTAMMGVPIQLAQVYSDYTSTIQGGISAVGNFLKADFGNALSDIVTTGINSYLSSIAPQVSTNSANGSFINCALEPNLVVEHFRITDEDNADLGRPLMATRTLNTLPGYIKCAEAHYDGSCLDAERDAINTFLLNGFFYE